MKEETAKKLMANIKFGQDRNAARKNKGQGLTVKKIELTPDDLIQKFSDQDGKCYWSGISLDESYNSISKHPLAISVDRLDNTIGYTFNNRDLLNLALIHKGSHKSISNHSSNERLEFLGDAVLGSIVGEFLFKKFLEIPTRKNWENLKVRENKKL